MKSSGDLPTTKVTPEFHQKLKDMKKEHGYKNVQQVQEHILELIAALEKQGGGTLMTQEQLQQQQMMVQSSEQAAAIGNAVDPLDRVFKMVEREIAMDHLQNIRQGRSRGSGGEQLDLGQMMQMQIIKGMQRQDELGSVAMMRAFDGEGKSHSDEGIKDLLHQMEKDRQEWREQLGRIERMREEDKADEQRTAMKAEQDTQRDVLMAFIKTNQEANHAFMASMTQMITENRAQGMDDVEIATQALQRQAAFVESIRETGKLLGLKDTDVEKEVVAAERTTADKIKSVFDGVGALLDKVSPLLDKALPGDEAAPAHAVIPPPGVAPALTAEDMPPGLTQEVLQAAMVSKPPGQNYIYTQDEIEALAAKIPADKEIPPLTVMPTPEGNCYLLSTTEMQHIEGLAAQAVAPAAEEAAAEGTGAKPGERGWVQPPEEEVTAPGEEPPEEPPGTTPPGVEPESPSGTGTVPEGIKIKVRTSASPAEEPEEPSAVEMHTCARCAETKLMPTPPYCDDCWAIEKAEEKVAAEEAEAEPEAENPLACQFCGKECKSRAGRSSHERSCSENPENKGTD